MSEYRYIFGPVPSRRLGLSLGVDVVPYKTCSYDCVYCQLGRTTEKTVQRREYVPVDEVARELERKLKEQVKIDYITFSGSGEPTLHSRLGELIKTAKRLTDLPVAVLTNGSLLWDDDVKKSLAPADLVVPSLDAGSDDVFRFVNRPCAGLEFKKIVEGMAAFCKGRRDKVWLEVFMLAGVNTTDKEMKRMRAIINRINPVKVQLNTVTRPPAEEYAAAVSPDGLRELADRFHGNVVIISSGKRSDETDRPAGMVDEVAALLRRRPCSVNDISGGLNLRTVEVVKYLELLKKSGRLAGQRVGDAVYYSIE